jgi:hypothetical protein
MQVAKGASFELSDRAKAPGEADLLGVWRVTASAADGMPAAPPLGQPPVPLWTVDLPADPAEATERLAECQARVLDAPRRLAEPVELLARACSSAARVETRLGGEPVARSLLSLTGGVRIVCRRGLGRSDARLHQDSVRLVLASREALLRVVLAEADQGRRPSP